MKKIAVAPCSWGVENPYFKDNPPWENVLKEAKYAGFNAIELGPYGYFPTDSIKLNEYLNKYQLDIIAGTLYEDLIYIKNRNFLVDKIRKICVLLSSLNCFKKDSYLVLIDSVKTERNKSAGNRNKTIRLDAENQKNMIENIKILSQIASEDYGIIPVIHPHAGGYIEFSDEIDLLLSDLGNCSAGLCLDTGHLYYAGDNPSFCLEKYSEKLKYIHFKDINSKIYNKAISDEIGFFSACKRGVMCPIGSGVINYELIFNILKKINYKGWITLEQEKDPLIQKSTLKDLEESYNYISKKITI